MVNEVITKLVTGISDNTMKGTANVLVWTITPSNESAIEREKCNWTIII